VPPPGEQEGHADLPEAPVEGVDPLLIDDLHDLSPRRRELKQVTDGGRGYRSSGGELE
jgi:hypothetical protein